MGYKTKFKAGAGAAGIGYKLVKGKMIPTGTRASSYKRALTKSKLNKKRTYRSGKGNGPDFVKRGKRLKTGTRGKNPKVSSLFKKKVQKALEGEKYHGRYEVHKHATMHNPTVNTVLWYDAHDYVQTISAVSTRLGALCMNSPLQIEDAVAVLWNQKTVTYDWTATVGNFVINELKFKVNRCDIEYIITNNTQRKYFFDIYECLPKNSTNTVEPLQEWKDILTSETTSAATPEPNIQTQNLTETARLDGYTTNWGPRPEYHPSWRQHWKHSITKVIVPPGGEYRYFRKAGSYNFDGTAVTLANGSSAAINQTYVKGYTHAYFIRVLPELSFSHAVGAATAHWGYFTSDAQTLGPVAADAEVQPRIERIERYFLTMPEITMPIDNATAGSAQLGGTNKGNKYAYYAPYDLTQTDQNTRIDHHDPTIQEGLDLAAEILHDL